MSVDMSWPPRPVKLADGTVAHYRRNGVQSLMVLAEAPNGDELTPGFVWVDDYGRWTFSRNNSRPERRAFTHDTRAGATGALVDALRYF